MPISLRSTIKAHQEGAQQPVLSTRINRTWQQAAVLAALIFSLHAHADHEGFSYGIPLGHEIATDEGRCVYSSGRYGPVKRCVPYEAARPQTGSRENQHQRNIQQWRQINDLFRGSSDRTDAEEDGAAAEGRTRASQEEARESQRRIKEGEAMNAIVDKARAAASANDVPTPRNPWEAEASSVKDPTLDYSGQSCSFFTKAMVRADGSGMNVYADGSAVCYGMKMYKCTGGRWENIGRCDLYDKWERHLAEKIEKGSISNQVYRPE